MTGDSSACDINSDSECSEDSPEMALPAAMVLSGIPKDQFTGNLETVFTQGSALLKSPKYASVLQTQASSRPSTSSSSAGSSSVAHCSSTVASTSYAPYSWGSSTWGPSTSGASTSGPSTSGQPTSGQPTSGQPTSGQPTSGPSTSRPSTSRPSTSRPYTSRPSTWVSSPVPVPSSDSSLAEVESGIASLSTSTDTEKSLDYYLHVINTFERNFHLNDEYPSDSEHDVSNTSTVIYEGRDLLDLGANLRSSWPLQYAELPSGVDNFFENRSQLSRVAGAGIPPYREHVCEDPDCGFVVPVYY